jgi:hypothetical protein
MSELDQMLDPPPETALPPLVRYWKSRIEAGDKLQVEVIRPEAMAGLTRTELVVLRWENGREQQPQQFQWDDELNAGLIGLGVKAKDLQQEATRFSLGIRAALRKAERRYGDGYLNAVLVDLIDESNLSRGGEIAEVRKFVYTNSPERSRSYTACRELIANEIGGRAVELRDKLKYQPDDVKAVMEKALATYLDERFSVSSRRQLGLL